MRDALVPRDTGRLQRSLYLLSLFRLFQACAFAALVLGPWSAMLVVKDWIPAAQILSVSYVIATGVLWGVARRYEGRPRTLVYVGAGIDLIVAGIALHLFGGFNIGVSALMLVTVATTAMVSDQRASSAVAGLAALIATTEGTWALYTGKLDRPWPDVVLVGSAFLITVALVHWLARRIRESEQLVERRGIDLVNLVETNELIIQRMRTGILLVDASGRVVRANESAWYLLGMQSPKERLLEKLAPTLHARWKHWLVHGRSDPAPLALAQGVPASVPSFTRIGTDDHLLSIVFLEDDTRVYRRAEELTLASLGRLSASIAHEVRNPLAAIANAAQLLGESEELIGPDRRLLEIISNHCTRVNGIVDNVLQLSRRERSRPEHVALAHFAEQCIAEFRQAHPLGNDQLRLSIERRDLYALVDPSQLTQALWNLIRNALRYGRQPEQPAEVIFRVRSRGSDPGVILEVIDRGPGIPHKLQQQLFEPFFTTRSDGTGLGLYITRQLIEANQGTIEHVSVAAGGSCFRITLPAPAPASLLTSESRDGPALA